jgi:hypothetical protein
MRRHDTEGHSPSPYAPFGLQTTEQSIKVKGEVADGRQASFNFDRIFAPDSSQGDVYEFVGR